MGTPTAPRVGDLVRLRGIGRGGPLNTGFGYVESIGGIGGPESISIVVDQIGGGIANVIFDYWDVGTRPLGNQLMLEQLFREKRRVPTDIAGIIGGFAGTSDPYKIPRSDQKGYKTGSSITNARPKKERKSKTQRKQRKHRTRKH
jgi:hypothetical protein